jgi:hypothetical protein
MDIDLYFSTYHGLVDSRSDEYRIARADRQPCPVCGHPTGDCVSDAVSPAHIIGFSSPTSKSAVQIFLEDDVWEERQITPFTKAKVLLYKKGQSIPQEEAERLGLI